MKKCNKCSEGQMKVAMGLNGDTGDLSWGEGVREGP